MPVNNQEALLDTVPRIRTHATILDWTFQQMETPPQATGHWTCEYDVILPVCPKALWPKMSLDRPISPTRVKDF